MMNGKSCKCRQLNRSPVFPLAVPSNRSRKGRPCPRAVRQKKDSQRREPSEVARRCCRCSQQMIRLEYFFISEVQETVRRFAQLLLSLLFHFRCAIIHASKNNFRRAKEQHTRQLTTNQLFASFSSVGAQRRRRRPSVRRTEPCKTPISR